MTRPFSARCARGLAPLQAGIHGDSVSGVGEFSWKNHWDSNIMKYDIYAGIIYLIFYDIYIYGIFMTYGNITYIYVYFMIYIYTIIYWY